MSIIGREIEVGIAIEGTRGTAEAAPQKWVKHVAADVIPRNQKVVDNNTRGRLEDSEGARIVRKWFEGELSGILHADVLGYLLLSLYGTVQSTVVTGAVTSHVFSLLNSITHPTLSIFRRDGAVESRVYAGGIVRSLEISASTEDYVRFTAAIGARTGGDHAETATYDTEYDFIGKDITVKVADTEGGLAAANALKLKTLTVRYDPGPIDDYAFGSFNPNDMHNGRMAIEIEFTKNYEDTTFEALFDSDAYKYMQVAIVGDADIGSANNPSATFVFNKAQVQNWERSGDPDALAEETVTLKAFFNATDGEQSTVTLQNLTAAYEADES
ncbi:MAG: phage tail tube protein [Thalassobaculum sp.]|uniref:phage tail tube protein n=1 Tax=Thalassobaculum sp. TaxID=2022740 RepID=UPI0032EED26E